MASLAVDWASPGLPVPLVEDWFPRPRPGRLYGGRVLDLEDRPAEDPRVPSAPALPALPPDALPAWAPHVLELPLPKRCPSVWHWPAWPQRGVPECWLAPYWNNPLMWRKRDPDSCCLIWHVPGREPHPYGRPAGKSLVFLPLRF